MSGAITWLLERNVFDDGTPQRIAAILNDRDIRCVQPEYVIVGGDDRQVKPTKPVGLADDEPVFVYGSMNLCRWLLRNRMWPTLAWYDFERLRCRNYYAHWHKFLLQRDYLFVGLADVAQRREELFKTLGETGRIFIRPDDNAKSFAGGVVRDSEFDTWWKRANFYNPGPETIAVVARPQTIQAEWRLVIANRKVVTGSSYRKGGRESISPEFPAEAADFAAQVAAGDFEPHPIYVMDVCETRQGYRVVEIGSVCCASLYACDLEKVVEAVTKAAIS